MQNYLGVRITIAVDFDGTCVTHEFPKVGKDIGAVRVLKKLVDMGHQLILFTMRGNKYAENPILSELHLDAALEWFGENGIPLYAFGLNPTQSTWTNSNKCYAQLYIDDAALGCPLIYDPEISKRPYVDWLSAEKMLIEKGVLMN